MLSTDTKTMYSQNIHTKVMQSKGGLPVARLAAYLCNLLARFGKRYTENKTLGNSILFKVNKNFIGKKLIDLHVMSEYICG